MKICHVNLAKGYRGGERQTELLIRALAVDADLEQQLIVRHHSPLVGKLRDVGKLDVREINKPHLLGIYHCSGAQLLHAHDGRACHFASLANRVLRIPYVITRRIPNLPSDNLMTHAAYGRAACIIAISRAIKQNLLTYDAKLQITIIPSMVAHLPSHQSTVKEIRNKFPDKFIVGNVGALTRHHKAQQYIIAAARQLQSTHPQLHFILVGAGRDEASLKAEAEGLCNITFIGYVDNVGDYLSAMDLFVFPSLEEGLGSILLDAMDFKLPIVASAVDGITDIVEHEVNGLLVERGNTQQIVEAITRLYENEQLRSQLTENGRERVKRYEPNILAPQVSAVYGEVLAGH